MSASVQCVATRTERTPSACARFRSPIVPIPGSSKVVSLARVTAPATAVIQSASVWLPGP